MQDTLEEISALRSELRLRILLQNTLLILCVVAFGLLAPVAAIRTAAAPDLAFVFCVVVMALSLQWCHHGVRQAQIKRYLVLSEAGRGETWERWLPKNRPASRLGTRWFVSTKGVFLGTQAAFLLVVILRGDIDRSSFVLLCMAGAVMATSAWVLLTNPKE